jgi:uncharacterized membrane protein YfcA
MGVSGGLLGVGGSVVMIPAMISIFGLGEDGSRQHLYQASAMICNFIIGVSSTVVHKKAEIVLVDVIKWLIPAGLIGILMGVGVSNIDFFSAQQSRNLTMAFGVFLVYVAVYNAFKLRGKKAVQSGLDVANIRKSGLLTVVCGLFTGFSAGLLGIGGGTVCVPLQQLFLKMPMKRAIGNSAAFIAAISLFGALYKNLTLSQHGFAFKESIRITICIVPLAILGAYWGGTLMHKLPTKMVRLAFIGVLIAASIKLLSA